MANSNVLSGNDGQIIIGTTAVAAVRNFSIEMKADTIETSVMGNDARTFVKGLSSFSGSADIYFDPTEFNAEASFNPTGGGTSSVGSAPVAAKFYVKQDATNDIVFSATKIIVTGYSVKSSMDGLVEASISFQGSDSLTFINSGNV